MTHHCNIDELKGRWLDPKCWWILLPVRH